VSAADYVDGGPDQPIEHLPLRPCAGAHGQGVRGRHPDLRSNRSANVKPDIVDSTMSAPGVGLRIGDRRADEKTAAGAA
jgi:hypothetical protein